MGTNYYLFCNQCEKFGEPCSPVHIGKSSVGWNFIFRAYEKVNSIEDWLAILESKNNKILDQYGNKVENNDLIGIFLRRNMKSVDENNDEHFFLDSKGFSFCKVDFS